MLQKKQTRDEENVLNNITYIIDGNDDLHNMAFINSAPVDNTAFDQNTSSATIEEIDDKIWLLGYNCSSPMPTEGAARTDIIGPEADYEMLHDGNLQAISPRNDVLRHSNVMNHTGAQEDKNCDYILAGSHIQEMRAREKELVKP